MSGVIDAAFLRPPLNVQRNDPCFCGSGKRFKSCCGSIATSRDPPFGVRVAHEFIDPDICGSWVGYLEDQPRRPLAIHESDSSRTAGLRLTQSSGRVTDKVEPGTLQPAIVSAVRRAYADTIPLATGRRIAWFENPQVLRYEPGGLYGPHADSDHFVPAEGRWKKVIDRDISLLIYLNQDFDGGELSFRQFNYRYRPRTGDLVFFPSHGHYAHQALPVRSGIRYVIVSWAACLDEPRVLDLRPSDCIDLSDE